MKLTIRPFLNTDPPSLVEIWRRQRRFRGLVDRISHSMVDDLILAKPYFDRDGLLLAWDGEEAIGFIQTGFGPTQDRCDWDSSCGVISQLRVVEHPEQAEVAAQLMQRSEEYLRGRGATVLYIGGPFPDSPYFQGLYGGSRIPGALDEDLLMRSAAAAAGFQPDGDVLIFQRRLAGFRTTVDRQLMSVRRQYQIVADTDPTYADWWEACTLGECNRTRFLMRDRKTDTLAASVTFWDIQPLAGCWGVHAMGLYDLHVEEEHRRCGLATFLVGEALRHLGQEGVGLVEAQSPEQDEAACGVFTKHGFEVVGRGHLLIKRI